MSCQTDSPCSVSLTSAPSPDKRVRYGLGMLLGVADFEQEQAWFLAQDRGHARALHGCGVVCGLGVAADGVKLSVDAGLAVDGLGRLIHVSGEQCADLNAWLSLPANQKLIGAAGGKTLHVVLRYCECATDPQPVPGQPCRTAEESQSATRITASFSLDLAVKAPSCPEEAATVRFGHWLRRLRVGAGTPLLDAKAIADELAALAEPKTLDLGDKVKLPEKLEELGKLGKLKADAPLYLPADQAEALLRHALALWAQQARPLAGCPDAVPADVGVTLASLSFTLAADFTAGDVNLLEIDPPVLLSTRLIQEALLNLSGQIAELQAGDSVQPLVFGGAGAAGSDAAYSRADHVHPLPALPAPPVIPAATDSVEPLVFGGLGASGSASGFSRADHVHPLPALPAIPALPALDGDVVGVIGDNRIEMLQGKPVKADSPKPDQVLTFKDDVWQPLPAPTGNGDTAPKDVVLRPAGLPDYAIVAAGVVASGRAIGPVYNKLEARVAGDGLLLLVFDGYKQPTPKTKFALLIKALPVVHKEFSALSVSLAGFDKTGFLLEILSNGKAVGEGVLDQIFVHVEVSQYSA